MFANLDPHIVTKLRDFAARRRNLIILKGTLAVLATFVAGMLVVSAVDYKVPFLPEPVRLAMSGTVYLGVLLVAWFQLARPLLHAPNERQIARLVEHAEPKLREDLLSAVELGETKGDVFDSLQFRQLLQSDVATRMDGLRVQSLLPVSLIKRSIKIMALILVAMVGLMFATGFRLNALFMRAILPLANLERVSNTRIKLIAPNPGNFIVPQGESVKVIVELSGDIVDEATLETPDIKDGPSTMKMVQLSGHRFEATIQVARQNIRYRIQAGDGRTAFYELTAATRPHEVEFEKIYHYPAFTKYPDKSVKEETGTLAALEGTNVELKIKTDQPVESGSLSIEAGSEVTTLPLSILPDGRLSATVPLKVSGIYRVNLVARDTKFENKFSPEYEMRAEPDLIPTLEILEPLNDLISPANDTIKVVANADDDIGIAKVAQMIKINDSDWREVVLNKESGQKLHVVRNWDLSEEGVKEGDIISTQFTVTDMGGHKASSREIQVIVGAAGFAGKRLVLTQSLETLDKAINLLAAASAGLDEAAAAAKQKFDETPDQDPNRKSAVVDLTKAYANYDTNLSAAWVALDRPIRDLPANHASADLVLLGRLLAQIHSGKALQARKFMEMLDANPGIPGARELMQQFAALSTQIKQLSQMAREASFLIVSAEQIDVVSELGIVLSAEQEKVYALATAAKTAAQWAKVDARLSTVLSVSKSAESVLELLKSHGGSIAQPADGMLFQLASNREKLERAIESGSEGAQLPPLLDAFRQFLNAHTRRTFEVRNDLAKLLIQTKIKPPVENTDTPSVPAAKTHRDLAYELGSTWQCLEDLRREQDAISKLATLSPIEKSALVAERWESKAYIFKARADLEEIRAVADNAFVSDMRRATVALPLLLSLSADSAENATSGLDKLDQCLRLLESGHDLQEVIDGLMALGAQQRWELRSPQQRTAAVRDWLWITARIRMAPAQIKALGLKDEAARKATESVAKTLEEIVISTTFLASSEEFSKRGVLERAPESVRTEVEILAAKLRAALSQLRKPMEAARTELAKLTPKISELALALARDESLLKLETVNLAGTAAAAAAEANRTQTIPQLIQQQRINLKIETLRDLIRADANEQDILQKHERERMRDADDALALLKDPPTRAEQALMDAMTTSLAPDQRTQLETAVIHQQLTVDALNLIAKQYSALEEGRDVAESRAEMRAVEPEKGIQQELDKAFAKAADLAALKKQSAKQMRKSLEAKLSANPEMKKELNSISQNILAAAKEKLKKAVLAEAEVLNLVAAELAENKDPKKNLTALEAATLAAALTKEAKAAMEVADQAAGRSENKAPVEKTKAALEKAPQAIAAADLLVDAAKMMNGAWVARDVVKYSKAVLDKADYLMHQVNGLLGETNEAANRAKPEAEKEGPHKADYQETEKQATLASQKGTQANEAAKQAQEAAKKGADDAMAVANNPDGAPENIELAIPALRQRPIQQYTSEAASEVERAGLHEQRLDNSGMGDMLVDLAAEIAKTAAKEVPLAQKAIRDSKLPDEALTPVQLASERLTKHLEALENISNLPSDEELAVEESEEEENAEEESPDEELAATEPEEKPKDEEANTDEEAVPEETESIESSPEEQRALARALDALEQQQNDTEAAEAAAQAAKKAASNEMTAAEKAAEKAQAEASAKAKAKAAAKAAEEAPSPEALAAAEAAKAEAEAATAEADMAAEEAEAAAENSMEAAQSAEAALAAAMPPPAAAPPTKGPPDMGASPSSNPGPPMESPPTAGAPAPPGPAGEKPGGPPVDIPGGEPSPGPLDAIAQSAMSEMRKNRSDTPPKKPGMPGPFIPKDHSDIGIASAPPAPEQGQLPTLTLTKPEDWGKLPKKLAEDLTKAQNDAMSEEYRLSIQTYYRVVAERSAKK